MIDDELDGDEPVPFRKVRPKLGEVSADAIRQAMREITDGELVRYASTIWDVYDPKVPSRRYPPKRILRNAIVLSGVGNWGFSGGVATNEHLEAAGFPVVLKDSVRKDAVSFAKWAIAGSSRKPHRVQRVVAVFVRSRELSDWVKELARGICSLCECDAPFSTADGPFLEAHHLKWMRNGGSDTFSNIVALCPNCHRRMHALNSMHDNQALERAIEIRFAKLPAEIQTLVREHEER